MKVILLKEVEKLGKENDIVTVKDGYARNYLIPYKFAIVATDENVKKLEEKKKIEKIKEKKKEKEEQEMIKRLEEIILKIEKKTTADNKLYGAVTQADIQEGLLAQYNINIDKKSIVIKEAIKELGKYEVVVNFSKGKYANLKIDIVKEEGT